MTIEYKDSKRIVGLSTESLLTSSDYTSSNFTTVGSTVAITNNSVVFSSTPTNADNGQHEQITALAESDVWSLDFIVNNSSGNTYDNVFLGLSSGSSAWQTSGQNEIKLQTQGTGYMRFTLTTRISGSNSQTASSNNSYSYGTDYYCTLSSDGTDITFKVWTNSGRTGAASITLTRPVSGLGTMNYIQHRSRNSGDSNTWSGTVSEVALSRTPAKPTDVQDNSLLVEKDTARRYWASNKDTIEDDYSSASGWTSSGAGNISITGGQVSASSLGNNDQEDRIYRTVSGVDSTDVTVQFEVTFSAWTSGAWSEGIAQLQSCTQDAVTYSGTQPDCDVAGVNLNKGHTNSYFSIITKDGTNSAVFTSGTATVSQGTKYYLTFEKSGNDMTLTSRTGSHSGSTHDTITKTQTGITGLNTLVHGTLTGYAGGTGYTTSYTIDNLVVSPVSHAAWTMQPTLESDFSSSTGWSQQGTEIAINTGTGKLDWIGLRSSTNTGISYDFGAGRISTSKWRLQFDLYIQNFSGTSYTQRFGWMLSTKGSADNSDQLRDFIGGRVSYRGQAPTSYQQFNTIDDQGSTDTWADNVPYQPDNGTDNGVTPVAGTTYNIVLTRDSPTAYTMTISSGGTLLDTLNYTSYAGTSDLRYLLIQRYGDSASAGSSFNGTIDNLKFYNGVTTPN